MGREEKKAALGMISVEELVRRVGGCAVVDGGLATQLEAHGADLKDPIWSSVCLISNPHLITKVHLEYLEAGADILITASYQATIKGFEARGISSKDGEILLGKSVKLACDARDLFWERSLSNGDGLQIDCHKALVAASVGSYGAFLADGSEYTGNYGATVGLKQLKDFHRRKVEVLAAAGADLIAFETIPCMLEAQALVELLEEENLSIPSWISFSSIDGINLASGDSFVECIKLVSKSDKVVAVGVNCIPPHYVEQLILFARQATTKLVIAYPNSGEIYDPVKKEWRESTCAHHDEDFVSYALKWFEAGANLIGGCCRTTPRTIQAIKKSLKQGFKGPHL